jgi:phosphoglycolate phosphatase-like HAD superfamily hydrolase
MMMRVAVLVEIEELVFDTRSVRVGALEQALAEHRVSVNTSELTEAHRGVPALLALARLAGAAGLDPLARELIAHRATVLARREFEAQLPSFAPAACRLLEALSAEYAVGVVTRAERQQADAWITSAGLAGVTTVIRSLASVDPTEFTAVLADVRDRLGAPHAVALLPPALAASVGQPGIELVAIDQLGDDSNWLHAILSRARQSTDQQNAMREASAS